MAKKEKEKEEKKEEKEEKEVEVPKHLQGIVKEIEEMKLVDLAKLVEILEEKFGVSSMPMAAAPAAAPAGKEEEKEEKSAYNVVLTDIGEKKIGVIKAVKKITQKGLKDCKDLVEEVATEPQTIKEDVDTEKAEKMKKQLEEAGATVELK